jgi:hypothetical protein
MTANFDLSKTQRLHELALQSPRDESFAEDFLAAVPHASLTAPAPQALQGPDGFPYFRLALPKPGEAFEAFSVAHVAEHCTKAGLGAIVLGSVDDASAPLWVFSYGDLCSWRQFGDFHGDPLDVGARPQTEVLEAARQVMVGSPSEEFFPSYARAIVGRYLASVGVPRPPEVKLVMDPARNTRQLMLNYALEDFPDRARLNAIMRRLSWFLPRGRTVLLRVAALADGQWTPLDIAH